jgi:hypothetical protein
MLHCRKTLFAALLLLTVAACSDDEPRRLVAEDVGADTALSDAATDVATDSASDAGTDAPADEDTTSDAETDTGTPVLCRPDNNGIIEADEVTVRAGLRATFKIATNASFDTAGTDVDGVTTWDLDVEFAQDQLEIVELQDPAGQWFETLFPTATYYTQLSTSSELLGVFESTQDALQLHGVVSPEDGLFKTEIVYDVPVDILKFPIQDGSTWTTDASVSGTVNGVLSFYDENYTTVFAGAGKLKTPYATFDVVRLRTDLTRTVGLLETKIRTYTFVAECFGTVATVVAQDNETEVEFQTAKEIRRLSR